MRYCCRGVSQSNDSTLQNLPHRWVVLTPTKPPHWVPRIARGWQRGCTFTAWTCLESVVHFFHYCLHLWQWIHAFRANFRRNFFCSVVYRLCVSWCSCFSAIKKYFHIHITSWPNRVMIFRYRIAYSNHFIYTLFFKEGYLKGFIELTSYSRCSWWYPRRGGTPGWACRPRQRGMGTVGPGNTRARAST